MYYRGLSCTLLALCVWLLASCATTPPPDAPLAEDEPLTEEALNARVSELVDRARESESPERENFLLEAAQLLVNEQEYSRARNLLTSINSRNLETDSFLRHTELLGQTALVEGAYFLAQRILTNPRLEQQWATIDPEQEARLREQRARLFALLGDNRSSVMERINLGSVLSDPEAEAENREQLWQTLMGLPREQLQQEAERAEQNQLRGWLELAALSKNTQANLERQQQQVDQWQQDWPNHPASRNLPNDLQLLRSLLEEQPRQIALLLPQQGNLARAAEAVRDGFLAAYYLAREEQSQVPQIRQYDTSAGQDIIELYEEAIAEGAELIVGPLDRDKVQQLYEQRELPVPVLTLNYTIATIEDEEREAPRNLYQFGLAAEDEARQIARRAIQEGHRQAMILALERSWTPRSARAFTREWRELGGEVAIDTEFSSGGYSRMVQQALLIDQSQARRQDIQRLLGSVLEFEPRRRQDVDMIFLMTDPEQGRQIRPTLSFHYAGDIPIYATSHIYTGEPDPQSNRDLNGVRFNTMPWLLDGDYPEKQLLTEHARAPAAFSRLHALGVDAFRLYPRLAQLEQIEQARLYGTTGTLRVRPGGRLERELDWAHFQGGNVRPLRAATGSEDNPEGFNDGLDISW